MKEKLMSSQVLCWLCWCNGHWGKVMYLFGPLPSWCSILWQGQSMFKMQLYTSSRGVFLTPSPSNMTRQKVDKTGEFVCKKCLLKPSWLFCLWHDQTLHAKLLSWMFHIQANQEIPPSLTFQHSLGEKGWWHLYCLHHNLPSAIHINGMCVNRQIIGSFSFCCWWSLLSQAALVFEGPNQSWLCTSILSLEASSRLLSIWG